MNDTEKQSRIDYFEQKTRPLLKNKIKYFSLGYNTMPLAPDQTDKLVERLKRTVNADTADTLKWTKVHLSRESSPLHPFLRDMSLTENTRPRKFFS